SKFGNKYLLCKKKTETTKHLFNANYPYLEELDIPIPIPLQYFLNPPHIIEYIIPSLLLMFSIWLTRNHLLHSDSQHSSSISPLFHSILESQVKRFLLLHHEYSWHVQELLDFTN